MSINPSTAINKALSRAAGESYVAYKLARNGWMAVNANSGVANMPNVDLICLRDKKRIAVQVKSAKADKSIMLAGTYKADGVYFNAKEGPKADFGLPAPLAILDLRCPQQCGDPRLGIGIVCIQGQTVEVAQPQGPGCKLSRYRGVDFAKLPVIKPDGDRPKTRK